MDKLLSEIMHEREQIIQHKQDGDLHEYIDDSADYLIELFSRIVNRLKKEEAKDAA